MVNHHQTTIWDMPPGKKMAQLPCIDLFLAPYKSPPFGSGDFHLLSLWCNVLGTCSYHLNLSISHRIHGICAYIWLEFMVFHVGLEYTVPVPGTDS